MKCILWKGAPNLKLSLSKICKWYETRELISFQIQQILLNLDANILTTDLTKLASIVFKTRRSFQGFQFSITKIDHFFVKIAIVILKCLQYSDEDLFVE